MNSKFKQIHIYYLLDLEKRGLKLGIFSKIQVWWSGLRPVFELELREKENKQRDKQAKEQEKEEQDEQEENTEPSEEKEI